MIDAFPDELSTDFKVFLCVEGRLLLPVADIILLFPACFVFCDVFAVLPAFFLLCLQQPVV